MNILITNASNNLSQIIGNHFSKKHNIEYIEDPSKKNTLESLLNISLIIVCLSYPVISILVALLFI